jgi:hypothetical protein
MCEETKAEGTPGAMLGQLWRSLESARICKFETNVLRIELTDVKKPTLMQPYITRTEWVYSNTIQSGADRQSKYTIPNQRLPSHPRYYLTAAANVRDPVKCGRNPHWLQDRPHSHPP